MSESVHELRVRVNQTQDGFPTEAESQKWIADFMRSTGVFCVYEQVVGYPIYRHHLQEQSNVRADVLLIPKSNVEDKIRLGAIVIEVKKSGVAIGPAISQLKDYLNSVFIVDSLCEVGIIPTYGFVFPCYGQNSATASWMSHQHMGTIQIIEHSGNVCFCSGEERLLEFFPNGGIRFYRQSRNGRKTGSR
ncbi:MAG: hypothetical protein EBR82_32945 [Caulobacteraceae bacterium]|nr:hypothetical protein [Caulobacteraceae bacterium]